MHGSPLPRRGFLLGCCSAAAAVRLPSVEAREAGSAGRESPVLLSNQGCGRATGYAEANKIVTNGERTHVAWLDSPPEGFRVRVRSLDRSTDTWSPVVTVGSAHDNHGGPALTVDGDGYLHIVYFPHHHAMRYRRSARPHDATDWEAEMSFGERLTYPTLVAARDGTLLLTARRSFPDRPWQVESWRRPPGGQWERAASVLQSRYPGYAHFQESLAWSPDHQTLHLCCRFHERTDAGGYGRLQAVAYLVSPDGGNRWCRSDGTAVDLPATADSAEILADGGVDAQRILRAGSVAVDSDGRAWVVFSVEEQQRGRLWLARARGDGSWRRIDLSSCLPPPWSTWKLIAPAGVVQAGDGSIVVTAQIQQPSAEFSTWGNPTNEVVTLRTRDGGETFAFSLVSAHDPRVSQWLPNLERPTGHHPVPEAPGVLFTAGPPGDGNSDLLSNDVFFSRLAP